LFWYHNRQIEKTVGPYIQRQIANFEKTEGAKTILQLAVKAFLDENPHAAATGQINADFVNNILAQVKVFFFAGHDTTSATLTYIYYSLAKNPAVLAKLRAELDEVLGPDTSRSAATILETPSILNQLPYTNAVIKETLRLWSPVSTVRDGVPGLFMTDPKSGKKYPTENYMMNGCNIVEGRNPYVWHEVDNFMPERFLVRDENDPFYVRKNSWRPFELGLRNCIGQEFAGLEMRMVLALTIREFDLIPAFPEDAPTVLGEQCYQVKRPRDVTAHPKDGLPVKIMRRVVSSRK
jgi:cytochrome P450